MRNSYTAVLTICFVAAGSIGPVAAQDDAAASADQAALIDAAKQEGQVTWYSSRSPVATQAVAEAFQRHYPEIQVDIQRLPGFGLWERIIAEAAAGRYVADVYTQADYGIAKLAAEQGLITPYVPPNAAGLDPQFLVPGGYGFSSTVTPVSIVYNTDLVPEDQVPRSWADLLDPQWAGGKIGTGDPRLSGQYAAAFWEMAQSPEIGEAFFEQLAAQEPVLFEESGQQINSLALGEYPVMIILEYRGWEFIEKGAPIGVVYPTEGMGWGTDYTHLMANAPHPNAARLFMDFYASQEGTDAIAQALGFYTVRDDVGVYPEDLGRPPLSELRLLPADPEAQTADAERFATWYGQLFD